MGGCHKYDPGSPFLSINYSSIADSDFCFGTWWGSIIMQQRILANIYCLKYCWGQYLHPHSFPKKSI